MPTMRLQYQTRDGIEERLYPVGADVRCMADAMAALAHGAAVLIEPLSGQSNMAIDERPRG